MLRTVNGQYRLHFMKRFRAFLIALICIALPYSATATMLQGMQCHHDGLGSIKEPTMHEHGDHDAHAHHHDHGDLAKADKDDHGCDCAVKCTCEHHCASSCAAAVVLAAMPVGVLQMSADVSGGIYAAPLSDLHGRSVFRPPISALPSAA